ncbi:hypothetical protein IEQ34_004235 [Dendrobium chrysotoxum]|uniref:Uncharacterized protein n=1 Tax=Dendrobium chrysotoxum TaxID=161865 RepID=A0AAV7HGL6_DENCH|nr:hypothetical protein IEQ34_004235 [Dendrobium chrysotoxum]
MARPAARSSARRSLLVLGKLSSNESKYAEKNLNPSLKPLRKPSSSSSSKSSSASSSTTVTIRGRSLRILPSRTSRWRAEGETPWRELTQLTARAVAAEEESDEIRVSRSRAERSASGWWTTEKRKGTAMRRANFSIRAAISRMTRRAVGEVEGTTVVIER